MKVKISRDEYDQNQIIVKNCEETVTISYLVEYGLTLETNCFNINSIVQNSTLTCGWSEFTIKSRSGNEIVDFIKKEGHDIVEEGYRINIYSYDSMNFGLNFIIYYYTANMDKGIIT